MCNRCEKDLDSYNKSLQGKTHLLQNRQERKNSFGNIQDFSQQNNGTASGAPKNVNNSRQQQYVAGDDSDDDYKPTAYQQDEGLI